MRPWNERLLFYGLMDSRVTKARNPRPLFNLSRDLDLWRSSKLVKLE